MSPDAELVVLCLARLLLPGAPELQADCRQQALLALAVASHARHSAKQRLTCWADWHRQAGHL